MVLEHLHHHRETRQRADLVEDDLTRRAAHSEPAAFASLNPDLRAVLVATAIDGLTTREAANLPGIPQER